MAIKDIYSFPTLLKVIGQLPPPSTYILNTFFQDGETFETESVEIQTMKGSKPIAPYVSELQPGKVILRTGFMAKQYKPALIKPARPITAIDLKTRAAGESLINPDQPEVRARKLLAKDIVDLQETITRRLIQQAAELMFQGKITQIGEGVNQVIDYDFENVFTLSGEDLLSNPNSDPIAFLAGKRKLIMDANAPTPNIVLADYDAAVTIMRHPKVLKLAENRGVDVGVIDTTLLPDGVTYHGRLRDVGLDVYSYTGTYTNDEGEDVPFIPEGTIAILSTRDKFTFHYGANVIMDPRTEQFVRVMGKITPQSWVTVEPAQRWLQMLSRPLAVPSNVAGWVVAKVI
ncbi:major capsid protein [Desulfitobacterium chlororespirans]|uniref:Phage major capsid protein E n=1 Tax=Desulfitobacterium chlororespirans DSM 11544 TaxID=1121395 RepID=A0A1M7U2S6_9FIRM|nr:major capsid protein [Desulfitobacterium chlororespirans]SHN77296.1 Phage major capsid protein E [Desulfitobacterium chlororespirans DSM 11544]